jgi:hypothetical protein
MSAAIWPRGSKRETCDLCPSMLLLAARDLGPFLTTLGVMIVVLVVATAGLLWFRARVLARSAGAEPGEGLLKSLRDMRDRGEISPEEYDAARRAMALRRAGSGQPDGPARIAAPPARPDPAAGKATDQSPAPTEFRARPGYDLTGRPLPPGARDEEAGDEG